MVVIDLYTNEVLAQFGTDTSSILYTTKEEWELSKSLVEEERKLKEQKSKKGKDGF